MRWRKPVSGQWFTAALGSSASQVLSQGSTSTIYTYEIENCEILSVATPWSYRPTVYLFRSQVRYEMSRNTEPWSLVCAACWSSIFSTADFQALCRPFREDSQPEGPEYRTTLARVEEAAAGGCTWCRLILIGAISELDSRPLPEVEMNISLTSFGYRDESFTPVGKNRALILINGRPLHPTLFTTNDDMVAEIVTARELDNEVNTARASKQIHTWLTQCDHHQKCGPIEPFLLPSRVIEVGPEGHPEFPRLFEAKGAVDYYAALSYCWGFDQTGLTTINNIDSRLQRLDMSTLSRSIQDAITTTRKIGIKYLWIDALCIIQDSIDDKVIELASMCRTYQHATVTIVAASANSANQGFLEDRNPPKPSSQIPFWSPDGKLSSVSLRLEDRYDDEREPINTRAWTLQEQLLSPRLLIYATHTLQYHCQQYTVNLGNSINIPAGSITRRLPRFSDSPSNNLNVQDIGRVWGDIITMYSQRHLSYLEDKLTALAGIAEAFSSKANTKYLAGLWSGGSLPRLLLWRVLQPKNYAPISLYTAPSWSWASINSPVFYSHFHKPYTYEWYGVEVITCEIALDNAVLPFGRVRSGYLKLVAYVRNGFVDGPRSLKWSPSASSKENASLDSTLSAELDDASSGERDVICLAIARRTFERTRGDAIEPVIDGLVICPNGDQGTYRRVGCFSGLKEKEFKGFSHETVTLV
jgi:hypothetical protein